MVKISIRIDPEFKALIPPLSPEEFAQLEENCVRDGIRDPLVVWPQPDGSDILMDGHNRWAIFNKHPNRLDLNYRRMQFISRDEAKAWIIKNQLGRRNINGFVRSELALQLKTLIAKKAEQRMKAGKADPVQKSAQGKTRDELATIAGVSHDTIHKVETIKAKGTQAQIQQARSGEKSINRVFNEVMEKESKRLPSAKEYAEQAKERHEEFKERTVVSVADVQQDRKDKKIIEREVIQKFNKTLNEIDKLYVLINAGEIPVNVLSNEGKTSAIETLAKMKKSIEKIWIAINGR